MQRLKNKLPVLFLLILFFYLLFFPQPALTGARDGLLLWYRSVLPVLFPFMLLCSMALQLNVMECLPRLIKQTIHFLFGCSPAGCFAVLTGFFCGFPMGAKITSDLLAQKKIHPQEARHLYGFVNNLSPVFLTSYLAFDQMKQPWLGGLLLFQILGAAVLYGILTSAPLRQGHFTGSEDGSAPVSGNSRPGLSEMADRVMEDAVRNIVKLGICIMLFSMAGEAVRTFAPEGSIAFLLLRASIEVTGGIRIICSSGLSFPCQYVLLSMLCAFGGWSAFAQTVTLAHLRGDTLKYYVKSRVMITLLSGLLSVIVLLLFRQLL